VESQTKTPNSFPRPAGPWERFYANFCDSIFIGAFEFSIFLIWVLFTKNTFPNTNWIFGIMAFLYLIFMLTRYGATFGKQLYGLKVIQFDTKEIVNLKGALIREFLKFILGVIPFINLLAMIGLAVSIANSPEKRGFHDKLAGTQVLRVKPIWSLGKQLLTNVHL
jgi:uncharacterized RDD family membrane protein YckC